MTKLPQSLQKKMSELSKELYPGDKHKTMCFRFAFGDGFNHGAIEVLQRAEKLSESLKAWLDWEAEQIKKDGPYIGKRINELIAQGNKEIADWEAFTKGKL